MLHRLFASTPMTQGWGWATATADGPSPHVDCDPTFGDVEVGKLAAGPIPQVKAPGLAGDTQAVKLISPKPKLPFPAGHQARLRYQRNDRSSDEIPIVGQVDRDDRLNVEDVLSAFVVGRPVPEIGVVLHRYADEV